MAHSEALAGGRSAGDGASGSVSVAPGFADFKFSVRWGWRSLTVAARIATIRAVADWIAAIRIVSDFPRLSLMRRQVSAGVHVECSLVLLLRRPAAPMRAGRVHRGGQAGGGPVVFSSVPRSGSIAGIGRQSLSLLTLRRRPSMVFSRC